MGQIRKRKKGIIFQILNVLPSPACIYKRTLDGRSVECGSRVVFTLWKDCIECFVDRCGCERDVFFITDSETWAVWRSTDLEADTHTAANEELLHDLFIRIGQHPYIIFCNIKNTAVLSKTQTNSSAHGMCAALRVWENVTF